MNGQGIDFLLGVFILCVVPAIPTLLRKRDHDGC